MLGVLELKPGLLLGVNQEVVSEFVVDVIHVDARNIVL
jgi:hypothetical protein